MTIFYFKEFLIKKLSFKNNSYKIITTKETKEKNLDEIVSLIVSKINKILLLKNYIERISLESNYSILPIILKLTSNLLKLASKEEVSPFLDHIIDVLIKVIKVIIHKNLTFF